MCARVVPLICILLQPALFSYLLVSAHPKLLILLIRQVQKLGILLMREKNTLLLAISSAVLEPVVQEQHDGKDDSDRGRPDDVNLGRHVLRCILRAKSQRP